MPQKRNQDAAEQVRAKTGRIVGALVAILQAATQIQEQPLTLLPKVIAVGLACALFGRFGLSLCEQLLLEAVARIPQLVRG